VMLSGARERVGAERTRGEVASPGVGIRA
jgi:hypothetical protein